MEVVRKNIKHLHLAVYPPAGRVRVSVPLRLSDEAVRLAVVARIGWVRRKQEAFTEQEREPAREFVTGESHYVGGRRYLLDVVEREGRPFVTIANMRTLRLTVRPRSDLRTRAAVVERWYREQLRGASRPLIAKWEISLGVRLNDWGIRRMRTRWGTCNPKKRRIWLNLELAKKMPQSVEYVVLHELVHLRIRKHGARFKDAMDMSMPDWRLRRDALNRSRLVHEDWDD